MRRSFILICVALFLSMFANAQSPTITFSNLADKYAPGFPADVTMRLNSNGCDVDQLCMISYEIKRNGVVVENIEDYGSVRYGVRLAGDSIIYRDVTSGHGLMSISVTYDGVDYNVNAFTLGIFDSNSCVNRNRPVEVWTKFDSIGTYSIDFELHKATVENDAFILATGTTFVDCNSVSHADAIVAPEYATMGDLLVSGTETVNVVPSYAITFVGLDENDEVTALPPARVDSIMQGDDYVFSITPSQCKTVASVTVGEETLTATEGMYTIANVQSDTTITVAFDIIKHTLTMTAGANGSVAESEAEVDCGTDYTVTFVPNSGYKLGAVTLDGEPVTEGISGNSYTISNVLADHTIHGEFIEFRGPYAEYVNLESNYEVGDTIDFSVKMHANCMYENLCAVGYELIYWNTDTTSTVVADATRYGVFSYNVNVTDDSFVGNSISNGSGNITYTAEYENTTYNVGAFTLGLFDAEAGRDRTIDYNMIFTTSGHYQFKTTLFTCANGGDVIGSSFEVANCDDLTHYDRVAETCSNPREANVIVQDINITGATIHTVTATVLGGHGTVSPSGTVIYEAGEDVDVVFTPDEYYALDTVMVNGIMRYPSSGTQYVVDSTYHIANISENYNITVKFKDVRPYYNVHVEVATAGGTVTPKDTSVVIGSDVTLRVSPNDGYHISQLSIDGNIVADYASNEIIFRDIHEDHEVSISFFPNSVEENMFANLSIYPNPNNGQFTVSSDDFDGDVTFQIFSVSGAMMDERLVNGEKTVSFDKSLPAGTYFLRIIAGEKVATKKVVVE